MTASKARRKSRARRLDRKGTTASSAQNSKTLFHRGETFGVMSPRSAARKRQDSRSSEFLGTKNVIRLDATLPTLPMTQEEFRLRTSVNRAAEIFAERIEDCLYVAAEKWPSNVAIVDGTLRVSYQSLAGYATRLAQQLVGKGLTAGDRVAVFLDKSIEAVAALFGAWAAGAVVVPINEKLKTRQVAHILAHSGAAYLVSTARKCSVLAPDSHAGVTLLEPHLDGDERPFRSLLPSREVETGAATILYTSGSTGLPKGILVSHENLLAGTRIVSDYLKLRSDDRILSVLPFSFDYGLNQLLAAVNVGATLVLLRSSLPAEICRVTASEAITGCAAVPPFWIQLISDISPFRAMRFPDLRYITNSGGTFPVELVKQYRQLLPDTQIYLMYGLSEAFRSTYLPPEEIDRRPDSIGKAIPETEILVVKESGDLCGPGEVGELVHRGPTVAVGYWQDAEATARVFRRDTLRGGDPNSTVVFSGDLVRKDESGFLYFVGRRDKMIKTLGYRVSPEEVEEIILACPLVRGVAVCGRVDPERGAAIVAHVVPVSPSSFALEALIRYCRSEMPGYMQPLHFVVRDELPLTPSGKIDRRELE